MEMKGYESTSLQQFDNYIALKYQLYNSLFTHLPFQRIEKTGILLSLFANHCEEGYAHGKSPHEVIQDFFSTQPDYSDDQRRNDLLFRFVQFAERQVVLFDALEEAAFDKINDLSGKGTLKQLQMQITQNEKEEELRQKLDEFAVQITLTAHPTQFYPQEVLGIIWDLSKALQKNNTPQVNTYLQQLGKTAFFKKEKPTPYDEAMSLIWFLENVFYEAGGNIMSTLKNSFPGATDLRKPVLRMGFWPGGDRDGNPFVLYDTTLRVAAALRGSILKCYYLQLRRMKRRLTFRGVHQLVSALEAELYQNLFIPGKTTPISKEKILKTLREMKAILIEQHDGLFLHLVEDLITKVHLFGLHFAKLDVRQDSSMHNKVFEKLEEMGILPKGFNRKDEEYQIEWLMEHATTLGKQDLGDPVLNDIMQSMRAMKTIQETNGEEGCSRYIISHATSALDMIKVYALFLMSGWEKEELRIDIIPLIETVDDLRNARHIMESMYQNKAYRAHLQKRDNTQTVMLGFSDGSKDGGYLMGNWSIYKAKESLTAIAKKYDLAIIFFDGRGGPPARGGGKTHKFYASMGKNISNREIQLTIQGQTVSSNFGTVESAQYNLEQLVHAGIINDILNRKHNTFTPDEESLLQRLANDSFTSYSGLKNHPEFMNYMLQISPLRFYSDTNIGSRPTKRGAGKMTMEDLRAIPFVASWSQLKQNVTGFFGVGTALQKAGEAGNLVRLQQLYKKSLFFKTLIDNSEMAMKKCFFPLTAHLATDPQFGGIWKMIYDEYKLTRDYLQKLTGNEELMKEYPIEERSVTMRERIILPLLTIQQYAMHRIREAEKNQEAEAPIEVYGKMVMRCSFGIINAGRNSA